jgi:hypothetical protein
VRRKELKPSSGVLVSKAFFKPPAITFTAQTFIDMSLALKLSAAFALLVLLPSCTVVSTPAERRNLASKVMSPERDPLGEAMADHMYFSREASQGGNGIGGGGCGCN